MLLPAAGCSSRPATRDGGEKERDADDGDELEARDRPVRDPRRRQHERRQQQSWNQVEQAVREHGPEQPAGRPLAAEASTWRGRRRGQAHRSGPGAPRWPGGRPRTPRRRSRTAAVAARHRLPSITTFHETSADEHRARGSGRARRRPSARRRARTRRRRGPSRDRATRAAGAAQRSRQDESRAHEVAAGESLITRRPAPVRSTTARTRPRGAAADPVPGIALLGEPARGAPERRARRGSSASSLVRASARAAGSPAGREPASARHDLAVARRCPRRRPASRRRRRGSTPSRSSRRRATARPAALAAEQLFRRRCCRQGPRMSIPSERERAASLIEKPDGERVGADRHGGARPSGGGSPARRGAGPAGLCGLLPPDEDNPVLAAAGSASPGIRTPFGITS